MTILLYKDGRCIIDEANPIEVSLDGLVLMLDSNNAGEALSYNGTMWTNTAAPAVLYIEESTTAGGDVVLDKTYQDISDAITAGKSVIITSTSAGTTTLTPLLSFVGSEQAGYTVTAGENTYTAATIDGTLTKEADG